MNVTQVITALVTSLILIPLNGLLLMLSAKIFKLNDQTYKTAFKVALISGAVSFVLGIMGSFNPAYTLYFSILNWIAVGIIFSLWLVKNYYQLEWGKAMLVWLVWFAFEIVAAIIIVTVIISVLVSIFVAIGLPPQELLPK